jgi:hypothetical protein
MRRTGGIRMWWWQKEKERCSVATRPHLEVSASFGSVYTAGRTNAILESDVLWRVGTRPPDDAFVGFQRRTQVRMCKLCSDKLRRKYRYHCSASLYKMTQYYKRSSTRHILRSRDSHNHQTIVLVGPPSTPCSADTSQQRELCKLSAPSPSRRGYHPGSDGRDEWTPRTVSWLRLGRLRARAILPAVQSRSLFPAMHDSEKKR